MNSLNKKSAEEWLSQEEKDIQQILQQLDKLPDFQSLRDHINELKNGLRLLQKTKNAALAKNVHSRAQHLHQLFEALAKEFGVVETQSAQAEQINKHITQEYILCAIEYQGHVHKIFLPKKGFVFGRAIAPYIITEFSRAIFNGRLTHGTIQAQNVSGADYKYNATIIQGNDRNATYTIPLGIKVQFTSPSGYMMQVQFSEIANN